MEPSAYPEPGHADEIERLRARVAELESELAGQEQTIAGADEQRRRLRAILDKTTHYVGLLTPEGILIECSQAPIRDTGLTEDEVLGHYFWDIAWWTDDDEQRTRMQQAIAEAARGRLSRLEATHRGSAGDTYDVNGWFHPVTDSDGHVVNLVPEGRDITNRQRMETALKESQEHLHIALSAGDVGTWRWSPDTDLDTRGANLNRILGRTSAYSEGTLQDFLQCVHVEDRVMVETSIRSAAKSRATYAATYRIVRPDGTIRWLRDHGKVFRDSEGHTTHITGAAADITECRTAEEQRQALEAQLRHAQKLHAIGQLAAGVAHDFNSLLMVILGNTQLLERALAHVEDVPELRERVGTVQEILAAVERGRLLVGKLLTFGRARAWNPQIVDLNDCIHEAEQILKAALGKRHTFVLDLAPDLARIEADRYQIEQVLMNLVLNARDAMPNGGTITLTTTNIQDGPPIDEASELSSSDPRVCLNVTDTGDGIDPDHLDRIFEPFFSTKAVGKGSGLGLSIVHGIVRQAHGQIDIKSAPGKGTTVTLCFPVAG